PRGRNILTKKLEKREQEIRDFIDDCDLQGLVVTKELLKEFYNGKNQKDDFYYHFDKFTDRKFKKIKKGTRNHYLLLRKQLKDFKLNMLIMDVDAKLIENFFNHLKEQGIGNSG